MLQLSSPPKLQLSAVVRTPAVAPLRKRTARFSTDIRVGVWLYAVLAVVHLCLLRYPPAAFFYNLDELDLTFSCLDRFLGVPSTIMMEPSTVLQMFSVPVVLTDFVFHNGVAASQSKLLSNFSAYLSSAYADPRHHVILIRAIVGIISSLGPVLLFAICRKLGMSRPVGLLCAGILALCPSFFGQSLLAAGDAPGVTVILGAVLLLLHAESGAPARFFAGFLFAMAVAFKLTIVSSLVILLAILFVRRREIPRLWVSTGQMALGMAAGLLLWWPYLWESPIRTAKAVLGNVNKTGSHADWTQFVTKSLESSGTPFTLFLFVVFAALVTCWRRSRSKELVLALLGSYVIMSVPLLMKATSAYPRYFMPLLLAPLLCFALLTRDLRRWPIICLAVLGLAMLVSLIRQQVALHAPDDLVTALKLVDQLPAGTKAYVPEDAAITYSLRLPQLTYQRIRAVTKAQLDSRAGVNAFLHSRAIPEMASRVLVTDFNEDEQANAAHMAAAAESKSNSSPRADIYLYRTSESDRTTWSDLDKSKAINALNSSQPTAVLLKANDLISGRAFWRGQEWVWYNNR